MAYFMYRAFAAIVMLVSGSAQALTFASAGTVPPAVQDAFDQATDQLSQGLGDSIDIRVSLNWGASPTGTFPKWGGTAAFFPLTYSTYRTALNNDRTTSDDMVAAPTLPNTVSISMLIDRTSSNAALHMLSTSSLYITRANAKAVGVLVGNAPSTDITINVNSNVNWDMDPSDGITPGAYDLVGYFLHEIGHGMGFISVVDTLVTDAPGQSDAYYGARVNSLDLFRYTAASRRSIASGTTGPKYFSIDGGVTNHTSFSLGMSFGDGRPAGHWKDNLGLGVMDPTMAPGELLTLSANDLRGFDVIGYDRVSP